MPVTSQTALAIAQDRIEQERAPLEPCLAIFMLQTSRLRERMLTSFTLTATHFMLKYFVQHAIELIIPRKYFMCSTTYPGHLE